MAPNDLLADPGEMTRLDAGRAEHRSLPGLRAALEHPAVTRVAGPAAAGPNSASAEELAELERRRQLLGYM